ncbi:MAG: phosphatidylglycerophosphatase A [Bryobacterales bacterium]
MALATWGGVGYFPLAPGTMGSLAAAAVGWLFVRYGGMPAWGFFPLALALFAPAAWAATETERANRTHDPGYIVVDEVVGQWLALAAIRPERWEEWLLAVVLFRLFDVTKPPPIRRLEKLPAGWGVVADDAGAGLCAMMILGAYRWLIASA